jgi:predicted TIM-barrel fold metal-dependent hydrolase
LGAGAVLIQSTANLARATSTEAGPDGLIDAHVHVWPAYGTQYPIAAGFTSKDVEPSSFTPQELFEHCRPLGVERIVLIQMNFFGFDNAYMLDSMRAYPGVFSGVAVVDHEQPNVATVMKDLHTQGVRGYRLIATAKSVSEWRNHAGIQAMFACGAESGQAMCMLSDPDALSGIDRLCERFPATTVVIDHFARIGMRGPVQEDDLHALCRLARFPNVYVKISAFYALGKKSPPYQDLVPMIRRLKEEYGASRLMWASDCPYQVQSPHTYAASLALVRDHLDFLGHEERVAVLRGTAEKVFFA